MNCINITFENVNIYFYYDVGVNIMVSLTFVCCVVDPFIMVFDVCIYIYIYIYINEPWPSGVLAVLLGVSVATCMAILQVGSGLQLRSASTGTKEEDYENDAATIVQKCVSVTDMSDGTIPRQELFGGVLVLMSNPSVFENSWRSTKWLDRPSVTLVELEERWAHEIKTFVNKSIKAALLLKSSHQLIYFAIFFYIFSYIVIYLQ